MKFLQPAILGIAAATATYFASWFPKMIWGAGLLGLGFFLWLAFIVALVRALKPE